MILDINLIRLAWLNAKKIPGQDIEQALLRLVIGTGILVYLFGSHLFAGTEIHIQKISIIAIVFELFSIAMIAHVLYRPEKNPLRRSAGIVIDSSAINYSIYLAGPSGALLFPFLIWITVGNGVRYGRRYMVGCFLACVIGLASVVINMPQQWSSQAMVAGVFLSLIILPLYTAKLIRALHEALDSEESARKDAVRANESKSRFIANASHEFRTPLNAIIGSIRELALTRLDPDQAALVNESLESSETLYHLTDNVLDFSKIEAQMLTLESAEFDIDHLLISLTRQYRAMASKKGLELYLELSTHVPVHLKGDALRLRQVLVNLVSNAIKFTEKGSVAVRADLLSSDNRTVTVRFEVADTGIGMSAEAQLRVFDTYTQADESITRRFGGTGLGTSIAKDIVTLMDGRIGVHSEPLQGSTFWFEIPFQLPVNEEPVSLENESVLVLTPASGAPAYLLGFLDGWGVDYRISLDPQELLVYMQEKNQRPDAIIIARPHIDIDIEAFIRAAKLSGLHRETRIILVDRLDDDATRIRLRSAGVTSMLDDPPSKTELYNALHTAAYDRLHDHVAEIRAVEQQDTIYSNQRILVADDSPMNIKIMKRILERDGHAITPAISGEDALNRLSGQSYDMVFLDLNMPDISGLDVYKQARMFYPEVRHTPFVLLTGDASDQVREEALSVGFVDVQTKPINFQKLRSSISTFCSVSVSTGGEEESGKNVPGPILDINILEELNIQFSTNGFAVRVINDFLYEGERLIKRLSEAIENQEWDSSVSDIIHALKGNASYVGAVRLENACRIAFDEMRARTSSETYLSLTKTVREVYFETIPALQNYSSAGRQQAQ